MFHSYRDLTTARKEKQNSMPLLGAEQGVCVCVCVGGGVIVPSQMCDLVTGILMTYILTQIPRGSESYQNKIYDWGSSLVPFR